MDTRESRRRFCRRALEALGVLSLLPLRALGAQLAESCPQTDIPERIKKRFITEAHQKRVGYVDHWEKAKNHEKFQADSNCANCSFYRADRREPTFGRCIRTAMLYVPSCAWCDQYQRIKEKKAA